MKFISLPCPACQQPLRIPAGFTGRQGRCAACEAVFVVNDNPTAETTAALDHYFEGQLFPQGLPASFRIDGHLLPPDDARYAIKELRRAADRVRALAPGYRDTRESYQRTFDELRDVHGGAAILDAGLRIANGDFGIHEGTFATAKTLSETKEKKLWILRERAMQFEEVAILRVHAALALLGVPSLAEQFRDARSLQATADRMRHTIQVVGELEDELEAASLMRFRLFVLECAQRDGAHTPKLTPLIDRERACLHAVLKQLQRVLHAAPDPFASDDRLSSVSDMALPTVPDIWDSRRIQKITDSLQRRLRDVWMHAWGSLAQICLHVEHIAGATEALVGNSEVRQVVLGRLAPR